MYKDYSVGRQMTLGIFKRTVDLIILFDQIWYRMHCRVKEYDKYVARYTDKILLEYTIYIFFIIA